MLYFPLLVKWKMCEYMKSAPSAQGLESSVLILDCMILTYTFRSENNMDNSIPALGTDDQGSKLVSSFISQPTRPGRKEWEVRDRQTMTQQLHYPSTVEHVLSENS